MGGRRGAPARTLRQLAWEGKKAELACCHPLSSLRQLTKAICYINTDNPAVLVLIRGKMGTGFAAGPAAAGRGTMASN